jgi:1-acyl-sn-glycerol-3-phosphate acyltransferase
MTARYFREAPKQIPDIETLVDILLFEVTNHFKLGQRSTIYKMIDWLGRVPAKRFAAIMQQFDRMVAEKSIWEAASDALKEFTDGWDVSGLEGVPSSGPLLVLANHPGAADSVAAMAAIERNDQSMIVLERPMLVAMPNFSQHMIYVDEENPARLGLMRRVIQKLKDGQTVIMFPRGNLEPDPCLVAGAVESINHWSESVGLFLSKVPDTIVQPLLISNVIVPKAWQSLIAQWAKNTKTRQQIAMILQVAMQRLFPKGGWKIPVKVKAPECVPARDLSRRLDPQELNRELIAFMKTHMKLEFPQQSDQDLPVSPTIQ